MPVLKKQIELNDGRKVWVRQASGMERLEIETKQAKVFRKFRHYGPDPTEWTEEQATEFATAIEEAEAGPHNQMRSWIPNCILDQDIDINHFTTDELMTVLKFVRGDDIEGAVPLSN